MLCLVPDFIALSVHLPLQGQINTAPHLRQFRLRTCMCLHMALEVSGGKQGSLQVRDN